MRCCYPRNRPWNSVINHSAADNSPVIRPPAQRADNRSAFFAGFRAMLSPGIGIATWGLVTGIAMAKVLSVPNAIGMSLLVFAGSAQLAALPLIAANLPLWTIFFTALIVNLRFVIFSAAIQPHFAHLPLPRRLLLGYLNGDANFVLFIQRYPAIHLFSNPNSMSIDSAEREAYFYGLSCCNWIAWQSASIIGILLAQRIPATWDVGFGGTLALLAIAIPLFADRAGIAAMLSAALVSLLGLHWPYRLNLVAAVLAATVVGLLVDRLFPAKTNGNKVAGSNVPDDKKVPSDKNAIKPGDKNR